MHKIKCIILFIETTLILLFSDTFMKFLITISSIIGGTSLIAERIWRVTVPFDYAVLTAYTWGLVLMMLFIRLVSKDFLIKFSNLVKEKLKEKTE